MHRLMVVKRGMVCNGLKNLPGATRLQIRLLMLIPPSVYSDAYASRAG